MRNAFGVEVAKSLPSALRAGLTGAEKQAAAGVFSNANQFQLNYAKALRAKQAAGELAGRHSRALEHDFATHTMGTLKERRLRLKSMTNHLKHYKKAKKEGIEAREVKNASIRAHGNLRAIMASPSKEAKRGERKKISRFSEYETGARLKLYRNPNFKGVA